MCKRFFLLIAALVLTASSSIPALADDAKKLDAPPAGLVPTTMKLSQILAKHDAAVGTAVAKAPSVQDWAFTDTGLPGTEHLVRSGTDYHSIIVTPAYTVEYGQLNGKRWHKDGAGLTTPSTATDYVSFTPFRVSENAADPKNDI